MANHFNTHELNAIPFTQVLEHLGVSSKRCGSIYRTLCPWHPDSNPSLVIYESTSENHCYCFTCEHGGSVIDFVMKYLNLEFVEACQWLSDEFCIISGGTRKNTQNIAPQKEIKHKAYTYIPDAFLMPYMSSSSSFAKMLTIIYSKENVDKVVKDYRLGCYPVNGYVEDVMFASIDSQGRIHNIKLQKYNYDIRSPVFGHCDHKHCMWLGTMLSRNGQLPADAVFDNNCMFGTHLLNERQDAGVVLVESPKNAVIGALEMPKYIWLAAGSKGMLKRESLECLRGRDVIVIPDRDAIQEWKTRLDAMNDITKFYVSDFCEKAAPHDDKKFDIADYFLSQRIASQPNMAI